MTRDRERFEVLFTQHYAAVVRYAVRRVGPDAAAEVVSETFLTAWRRLDSVPEHALPWLYATARRIVANELRRRRRQARLDERVAATTPVFEPDRTEILSDQLRVRAAMAGLSERDREVLRLAEWERLDAGDAARVMECTQAAYKVRLHRARRRLGVLLGADEIQLDTVIAQGGLS
jgi:RNA polymerase sigma-70 factor (ECF subfamily)